MNYFGYQFLNLNKKIDILLAEVVVGMSKYSDYTTVGGQVLAHRVRMMGRSWHILFVVGKISFFLAFFINLLINWRMRDIWNYLCILKAVYRNEMSTVSNLFSRSYLLFSENKVALPRWLSGCKSLCP